MYTESQKMTEKAKKSTKFTQKDQKYFERRQKNRDAVTKCRLKKELEEKQRKKTCAKLNEQNNYLEGQIHELKKCKKMFIELLMDQSKRNGTQLTAEQLKFINLNDPLTSEEEDEDDTSDDNDSEDNSSDDEAP